MTGGDLGSLSQRWGWMGRLSLSHGGGRVSEGGGGSRSRRGGRTGGRPNWGGYSEPKNYM